MRKSSNLIMVSISIVLVLALVLGGCSGGGASSAPASSAPPKTSSAAPPPASSNVAPPTSNAAPPPSSSSAAPPTNQAAASSAAPAAKTTLKVGLMSALSGFFASFAPYMQGGCQMAIDQVNKSGGILGQQVELVVRDDLGDPSQVPMQAAALKAAGVVGIVGTFMDANTAVLEQWANDNKMICSLANDETIAARTTKFNKYIFFQHPIDISEGKVLAQQVAKQDDVKSIYCVAADVLLNHDLHDSFWAELKKSKPSVTDLGTTFVGPMDTDFTNIITTVLSKKPDLVLNFVQGPGWVSFVQQGKTFKYFDKVKNATTLNLEAEATVAFGADFPTGIQATLTCPFFLDTPEMKAFNADFMSRAKGLYPGDLTMDYYIATLSFLQAIQKAGKTDTDAVIAAYETLTLSNTPLGTLTYNDYDHQSNTPLWYGTSVYSDTFKQAILANPIKFQDNIYPSKDEILALRAKK